MKQGRQRRQKARVVLLGVAGILTFLAIWELATRIGWVNATYVPPPTAVQTRKPMVVMVLVGMAMIWLAGE